MELWCLEVQQTSEKSLDSHYLKEQFSMNIIEKWIGFVPHYIGPENSCQRFNQ